MAFGKPKVADPSDPVLWCKEAVHLMDADDLKGAVYCYQESLKIRPEVSDVWYNLGLLLEKTGDEISALGNFTEAAKLFPNDCRFPAEKARLFAVKGKYVDAVIAAVDALSIDPYSPILLANKSGYLIRAGDAVSALEAADEALEIDPVNAAAMLNKAQSLIALGKIIDAENFLQEKISVLEKDFRAMKMFANVLVRREKFLEAKKICEDALLLAEDDDELWSVMGVVHANLLEKDLALEAFERAMKINPKEKSYKMNYDAVKKM